MQRPMAVRSGSGANALVAGNLSSTSSAASAAMALPRVRNPRVSSVIHLNARVMSTRRLRFLVCFELVGEMNRGSASALEAAGKQRPDSTTKKRAASERASRKEESPIGTRPLGTASRDA